MFECLRTLQILFYKFLIKWGKTEEDFESSILLESQKYYFAFESRLIFFFFLKWSYSQRCFDVAQRCSIQPWNTQLFFNVAECCRFQRWRTQHFNVDLTLCDVATSYQPKSNVKPTLKCLLGNIWTLIYVSTSHYRSFFVICFNHVRIFLNKKFTTYYSMLFYKFYGLTVRSTYFPHSIQDGYFFE